MNDGTLMELNRRNYVNDHLYYAKIMEIKKSLYSFKKEESPKESLSNNNTNNNTNNTTNTKKNSYSLQAINRLLDE